MTMTDEPAAETREHDPHCGLDTDHAGECVPADPEDHEPEESPRAEVVRYERHGHHYVPGTDLPILPAREELAGIAALAVSLSAAQAGIPKPLQNRPNDVLAVLMTARDVGVALTTALREFHVIEGRVTLSPKVKLALVRSSGLGRIWPDPANDGLNATWYAERGDTPGVTFSSSFSWSEAIQAGMADSSCGPHEHNLREIRRGDRTLKNACYCKDNWRQYPKRMLSWRAAGYLLDDVFPEVGTGLYSPDEMGALTDEDGAPVIDVTEADPLPGTKAPRGHKTPPDPNDEPAPLDKVGELRRRIDALSVLPDARAALLALWTKKGDDERPALPPLDHLLVRHVRKAEAMLDSIEKRARAGEWGEWTPPADPSTGEVPPRGPDSPPDAPETPAEPARFPEEPEAVPDVPAPVEAVPDVEPVPDIELVIREVKSMDKTAVVTELTRRGYVAAPRDADRRQALALVLFAEAGGDVPEAQMPARSDAPAPEPATEPEEAPPATLMEAMERAAGDDPEA